MLAQHESLTGQRVAHGHETAEELDRAVVTLGAFVVAVADHLDARYEEHEPEDRQHPPEPRDQRAPTEDEDGAQRERAEDAPEQDAVLVTGGDRERGEDDRPDEHVVDAERLLDHVAAEVLTERLTAPRHEDDHGEDESARHPRGRLDEGAARSRCVIATVQHEVDGEQAGEQRDEADPDPRGDVDVREVGAGRRKVRCVHGEHGIVLWSNRCDSPKVSPARGPPLPGSIEPC